MGELRTMVGESEQSLSLTASQDVWRRFRQNKLAMTGLAIIILLVLAGIFAPAITTKPWDGRGPKVTLSNGEVIPVPPRLPPCFTCEVERFENGQLVTATFEGHHFFGTDDNGRDVYTRVIYGIRISLLIGVIASVIGTIVGLIIGGLAGFYGGGADSALMRVTDIFLAIPYILLAIAIASVLNDPSHPDPKKSETVVVVVLIALGWMYIARIFRGEVISIRNSEYVQSARAVGASDWRIMSRHILPNSIQAVIVMTTIGVGEVILAETVLSFLGLGIQPPKPSWGLMVADGQSSLSTAPNILLFPAAAIFITVIAFSLIGDGLRDALDPRLR